MSSTIFYHETILRIPASHAGTAEDLFVHLCQGGSSNCYELGRNGRDGRRSRNWQVNAFGTEKQVLTLGIKVAGDLEGGMLKLGSATKWSKPETYIKRVRRLLKEAKSTNALEACEFDGESVSFSAFLHNEPSDSSAGKVEYNWRDPASFREFFAKFTERQGFSRMGFAFFDAYGPAMRRGNVKFRW